MAGPLVLGALVWVVLHVVGGLAGRALPLVPSMLALAVLVVVPAALPLHPWGAPRGRAAGFAAVAAATPLGIALLLPQGALAQALAVSWIAAGGVGTALAGLVWWRRGRRLADVAWPAACAYLVVGALWALADRGGLEPAGFGPPMVALTAIHFHYAGFASATLAACVVRHRPADRIARAAATAVVAAPPLVALGFAAVPALQVLGAVLLAGGLLALSAVILWSVAPTAPAAGRVLLTTSALAVIVPMLLAVQWAVGHVVGTPALSIPDMARWHGAVNAVGFSLAGVLGWRLVRGRATA